MCIRDRPYRAFHGKHEKNVPFRTERTAMLRDRDIGNGTMNILYINNKKAQESRCWREKLGVNQCMIAATNAVPVSYTHLVKVGYQVGIIPCWLWKHKRLSFLLLFLCDLMNKRCLLYTSHNRKLPVKTSLPPFPRTDHSVLSLLVWYY